MPKSPRMVSSSADTSCGGLIAIKSRGLPGRRPRISQARLSSGAARGPVGENRRYDGHAGVDLQVVLTSPRRPWIGTERPQICRDEACPRDPVGDGRCDERCVASQFILIFKRNRPDRWVRPEEGCRIYADSGNLKDARANNFQLLPCFCQTCRTPILVFVTLPSSSLSDTHR